MKLAFLASKVAFVALLVAAICSPAVDAPTVAVKGYVLDSACAFTKGLSKPLVNNVRFPARMPVLRSSFLQMMEPSIGLSRTLLHRVGRTRSSYLTQEIK